MGGTNVMFLWKILWITSLGARAVDTSIEPSRSSHEENRTDVAEALNLNQFCWASNESCVIIGTFTHSDPSLEFPVGIDCSSATSIDFDGQHMPAASERSRTVNALHLKEKFSKVEVITLNGCHSNISSFGIEHIPDAASVRHLTVEMFKIKTTDAFRDDFAALSHLQSLVLRNNNVEHLAGNWFQGLHNLTHLALRDNAMKKVDREAFISLERLQSLDVHERHLSLDEFTVLPLASELSLEMRNLKWDALQANRKSIRKLRLENVQKLTYNASLAPMIFPLMTEMDVINCNLSTFPLHHFPKIDYFNVSHNQLRNVSLWQMKMSHLRTLDISYNQFRVIDAVLLAHVIRLEYFNASHNSIRLIDRKAFQRNLYLRRVDIRFNQLQMLNLDYAIFNVARELQFLIDSNPWNCAWADRAYSDDPALFLTKFKYERDVRSSSMRGLRCTMYELNSRAFHTHMDEADYRHHFPPPDPIEIVRRNPKQTAIFTLCILGAGVSLLLLILFFYIKYRADTLPGQYYYVLPSATKGGKECDQQRDAAQQNQPTKVTQMAFPQTHYEMEGMRVEIRDILRPMRSIDVEDHFDDIEFKDLYTEMQEKEKKNDPQN